MSAQAEMDAATEMETRRFNWETRLVRASPFNLFWTGAIAAVLVYGSFLLCAAWNHVAVIVERDGDPTLAPDAWTALCMALLWWSVLSLGEYTRRANLAEAHALARLGVSVNGRRLKTLERGPLRAASRRALFFGIVGAIAGVIFYSQVYHPDGHHIHPASATLTNIWFLVMTVALFAEIFRSLSFVRSDTAAFIRDLDHRVEIDLFDISKLDGFGRIALRGALPWLVTGTIVLLLLLGQQSGELFVPLIVGLAASAAAVFAWPMLQVHRLIDTAKNVELIRLRREAAEARMLFERGGAEGDRAAIRLAALLALEARVERVLDILTR